jgi:hypothetical protein
MFVMAVIYPKISSTRRGGAAGRGGGTGATKEDVMPRRGTTLTPVEMTTLEGGTTRGHV